MRVLILGLLALAASVAAAQEPIPISLPDEVIYSEPDDIAGTEISVPVLIGADVTGRGIVSASIIVNFDPSVVSLSSLQNGSFYSGCSSSGFPSQTPGEFRVAIACSSSAPFQGGPGTLLTLSGTLTGSDAGSSVLTLVDVTPFSRREGTREINVPVTITNGRINVVTDPNPNLGAVDAQTIEEDGTAVVQFTLSDQDTPLASVTVTASASTALVPSEGLVVGLCDGEDAASPCRTLTLSPAPDANGTATITLTATDGDSRSDDTSTSFSLIVTPVNDAPTVAAVPDDREAPAGSDPIEIDLASVFADVDDATLTYSALSSDTEAATITVDGALATLAPVRFGTATLTLRATDGGGLTAETTFMLAVTAGIATENGTPTAFAVHGNAPNPAASTADVLVDLPTASEVQVVVYDAVGRRVLDASTGMLAAGAGHRVPLQISTLPAGIYVYRVTAQLGGSAQSAAGRMVVVR